MRLRPKVTAVTLPVASALVLGRLFSPPADVVSEPGEGQIPFFVVDLLLRLPPEIEGAVLACCAFSVSVGWRIGKLAEAIKAGDEAGCEA